MLPSPSDRPLSAESPIGATIAPRRVALQAKSTLLLLILLTFCALSQAYRSSSAAAGIDFYQFWAVGRAVARGEANDVYSDAGRLRLGTTFLEQARRGSSPTQRAVAEYRRIFETTATPFLYTVFGGLTSDDYVSNWRSYRAVLLACYAFSVVTIARLLRYTWTIALLCLIISCLWFEPLASDLRVGNVSSIQLASVVLYAWLRLKLPRDYGLVVAGTWLGLVVAFKPNLVFVPILVVFGTIHSREWKFLLHEISGLALGTGFAIGLSSWCLRNAQAWVEWLIALGRVPNQNITVALGNFSPWVLFREHCGASTGLGVATATVTAIGVGYFTRPLRRQRSRKATGPAERHRMVWLVALGCLCPVLIPHLAWLHYFVLTLPALLLALSAPSHDAARGRRIWRSVLAALAWIGLSVNAFVALGTTFTASAYAVVVITATYALLAATVACSEMPTP